MAAKIGSLLISLGLESGQFKSGLSQAEKAMRRSERQFEAIGRNMQRVGTRITAVGAAMGTAFVAAANRVAGEVKEMRVAAQVAGEDFERFQRQAHAAASVGIEFDKLGDIFKDVRDRVGDFITTGGGPMLDFFEQVAPKVGVTADAFRNLSGRDSLQLYYDSLKRAGVGQEEMVFYLEAMASDATALIPLLEDNGRAFRELGESAGVVSDGDAAAFDRYVEAQRKLSVAWRNLTVAVVNSGVLDVITGLVTKVAELAQQFSQTNPVLFRMAAGATVLALALGPALIALGALVNLAAPILAAGKAITAAKGAFAALQAVTYALGVSFGPLLLTVGALAAAGYLIYKNWDEIAPVLREVWQVIQQTLGPPLQALVSAATSLFTELWQGPLGEMIAVAGRALLAFGEIGGRVLGAGFLTLLRGAIDMAARAFQTIHAGVQVVAAVLSGDWAAAWNAARAVVRAMFGPLPDYVISLVSRMVTGIGDWVMRRLGAIWDATIGRIDAVKRAFFNLYDAVVGNSYVPDMVDGIARQMARLDQVMVNVADRATQTTAEKFRDMARDVRLVLDRIFPEAARLQSYRDDLALLAEAQRKGAISAEQFAAAQSRLRIELSDAPFTGGLPTPDFSRVKLPDVQANLEGLADRTGRALDMLGDKAGQFRDITVRAFDSFTFQLEGFLLGAQSALDAVRNLVRELASAALRQFIFQPLGAALGLNIPGYATGTRNHPGGLAMVGERGPELLNLPRGAQVFSNQETRGILAGGSSGPIFNINVHGAMSDSDARRTGTQIGIAAQREYARARRSGLAG